MLVRLSIRERSARQPRSRLRGLRAVAIPAALVLGAMIGLVNPPQALATVDYLELGGEDQYEMSVLLSQVVFASGVDTVVVANGDDFRLASCAASLAAAVDGPLLLTPGGLLDPRVRKEITRLDPERIHLVGVNPSAALAASSLFPHLEMGRDIVVLTGADVYDTARLVAAAIDDQVGQVWGVVLVPADETDLAAACAVSVSPFAAAKRWPLLFTPAAGPIPAATATALADLEPLVALSVGTSVDPQVPGQFVQLEGGNAYEVNAAVAQYTSSLGLGFTHVAILSGYQGEWKYGLAVAAYLARDESLILAVAKDSVPAPVISVLRERMEEIDRVEFCGPLGFSSEQVRALIETADLPAGFARAKLAQGARGDDVAWLEQKLTDLSYRPGPVDGVFDKRTRHALVAFEKWEGLNRDGVVSPEEWWRILVAQRPVASASDEGAWIEVDKKRQVLLYVVDGTVERTLAVSTGNARVGMVTPSGVFHITRENTRERLRYKPLYLRSWGVLAIHGYTSVPTYPASHGCVRMTWVDMDEFHHLIPVGTPVHIY